MQDITVIFIGAFIALFLARKTAIKVGLVDKPNMRKNHDGHIPLVGGISLYSSLWLLYALHPSWLPEFPLYMVCASVLFFVGILDDRFDLPVLPRIILQAAVACLMIYFDLFISTAGNILFGYGLMLGLAGYLITVFAVWGAINAFNMVDGMDGLLATLSSVTFAALSVMFYLGGHNALALWSLCVLVASVPYLVLNLELIWGRKFKVFMGDAGSTLVGFTVIWLLILATQGATAVMRPVTALWFIAIPLMDMAVIIIRRIRRGDSPFKPDNEHCHHILMRAGLSNFQALGVIGCLSLVFVAFGMLGEHAGFSESVMLSLFLLAFIGYFWSITRVWRLLAWLRNGTEPSSGMHGKVGQTVLNK